MILSWPPAKPIRCANSWNTPSVTSAAPWNGAARVWRKKALMPSPAKILIEVDKRYFRPTEVDLLLGDPSKARKILGWQHKIGFEALVQEMVEADLLAVAKDQRENVRE